MTTWTFGPNGLYTATWDGASRVTVTLTSGGAFVASFVAQSLTAALAAPEYQEILANAVLPSAATLSLVATTGLSGFNLVNGTPVITSWTAPNDGQMHRVLVFCQMHVTSTLTGGQVDANITLPDGVSTPVLLISANAVGGVTRITNPVYLIQGGSTFNIQQFSAVTAGAAVLTAEFWAS